MMRRRHWRPLFAVAVGLALSQGANAHNDDAGPLDCHLSSAEMGSSAGFFDYELVWWLKGSKEPGLSHNAFSNSYLRIDWARSPLETWQQYVNIKPYHVGRNGPVPTHRWYRIVGGGGFCFLGVCWRTLRCSPIWRPAQACSGGGGGGGDNPIGPH